MKGSWNENIFCGDSPKILTASYIHNFTVIVIFLRKQKSVRVGVALESKRTGKADKLIKF